MQMQETLHKDALARGKRVHVQLKCNGCELNVVVGTALVSMYSRCKSLHDARIMFDRMPEKNVISWNAMISACVHLDNRKEAIQLFGHMQQEGLIPNKVTFVSIVCACACEAAIVEGGLIHIQVAHRGFELDVILAAALVSMYGKCGSVEKACRMFDDMHEHCVVSWTAMLTAFAQHGHIKEAFQAFNQMQQHGILPNQVTFVCILSACDSEDALLEGKRIHAQIVPGGFGSDPVVATAVTHMYGKCGSIVDAHQMFNMLAEKNTVSCNAMISVCMKHGQSMEGIQLFSHMQQQGISLDKFTFVNILNICASQSALFEGKVLHHYVLQTDFKSDVVVCNALVDMYSKSNDLGEAQKLFDGMRERNVISWNSMITAYAQNGCGEKALDLFSQMQVDRVIPDSVTFATILAVFAQRENLCECRRIHFMIKYKGFDLDMVVATELINMYSECGSLKDAQMVFDRTLERDYVLWNAVIAAHVQHDDSHQALQLFDQMQNEGVIPNSGTFIICLFICTCCSALTKGKQLHIRILHSSVEFNNEVANALVDMYAECGSLQRAEVLFYQLCECKLKLWNAMIAAYAEHGKGKEAVVLFDKMQQGGFIPDEVTCLHLFSACSHSGLVNEGCYLLGLMDTHHGLTTTVGHYDCIIDLLGRAGQLNEAEDLIEKMPFKPTSVTWTSLLGACKTTADIHGGEFAANHLLEADRKDFVPYIVLSSIYAACNLEQDAEKAISVGGYLRL